MQRNILFVSHANPQDNDFTIWLTSRLQLLGYDVWIDKNALLGGEKFWEEIDQVIRNKAAKFSLVYSTNICKENSPGKLKDGIYKEYSLAESICKQYDLKDFIILMNIDGSEYNLFIGADRLNQIGFYENWAKGLRQLTEKLKKDQVHKNDSYIDEGFSSWYENQYIITSGITSKYELYYSNWWPIKDLPQQFYIYQFKTEEQARAIYEEDNNYPISKITNCLSSFESYLSFQVNFNNNLIDITPQNIFKVKTSDIFLGFESKVFPNHRDSENHFKSLLKRIFHLIMKNRRMFWYEMANRRLAYFYTPANLKSLKVKFDYPYRKNNKFKTKNLIGNYLSLGKWHYAVSVKPILYPILAFSLKNHLVFTDDGFQV